LLKQSATQLSQTGKYTRLFFSDANEDAMFHQNQLALDSVLSKAKGLRYRRNFYPEETHTSEPVKGFYDGIRFVYPDWHLPYNSSAFRKYMHSKNIKDHFDTLSRSYGYTVVPLHDEIIMISRFLRNDPNRIQDAVELLRWNAELHPTSFPNWETLGDTYLKSKDEKNALAAFKKAQLFKPSDKSLEEKISKLGK
jgi:hypothetical protein